MINSQNQVEVAALGRYLASHGTRHLRRSTFEGLGLDLGSTRCRLGFPESERSLIWSLDSQSWKHRFHHRAHLIESLGWKGLEGTPTWFVTRTNPQKAGKFCHTVLDTRPARRATPDWTFDLITFLPARLSQTTLEQLHAARLSKTQQVSGCCLPSRQLPAHAQQT